MAPMRMFLRRALLQRRPQSTIATTTTTSSHRHLSSAAPAATRRDAATKPSPSAPTAAPTSSSSATDTANANAALPTASSRAAFRLPIKHSHKKLPAICTDPVQLKQLTASILEASEGSLYMYVKEKLQKETSSTDAAVGDNAKNNNIERDRLIAWEAADQVVQKVEYLIRGHAHTLTGTQWNRWLTSAAAGGKGNGGNKGTGKATGTTTNLDPTETLQTMQALMDRIDAEGRTYMTMRSLRLEEMYGPKRAASTITPKVMGGGGIPDKTGSLEHWLYGDAPDAEYQAEVNQQNHVASGAGAESEEDGQEVFQDLEDLQKDMETFSQSDGVGGTEDEEEHMYIVEDGQNFSVQETNNAHETTDTSENDPRSVSYRNDFSSPGVTVSMYDALLDAMACQAATSSDFITPTKAFDIVSEIVSRHDLDGGDNANTNIHTRPTAVSYNAAIRIASELPFDATSEEPEDIRVRDDALTVAFGAFDALQQTGVVEGNSATYHYLLLCVAKYFPASRIRGNVAHGMFHHAQEQGLIDAEVVAAHMAANAPSNGPEFEEYMEKTLKGKTVNDLPHAWRRFNKVRRHHPRENIY